MARRTKETPRRIRYAVVGLGYISQTAMLPAFRNARRNCELTALVSDDATKLAKLGRQYRVAQLVDYVDYDALCASGAIDAVYIGLPNSLHRDYCERAAQHGVHVLCDKPLGDSLRDAQAIVDACRRSGVKLMTAYRLHFEPANLAVVELARSGKLGDLKYFTSQFAMQVKAPNIRLEEELGGGPLLDIGIYCINAARNLFRDEPVSVFAQAVASADPRFAEVPETVQASLRFPDDRLASFTCSFGSADVGIFQLHGTKAHLALDKAYDMVGPKKLVITQGERHDTRRYDARDQFAPLLTHFADAILDGSDPAPSGEEGLADLRVIEALERSIASGEEVRLRGPEVHGKRPTKEQAQSKPPVRKPSLVHARSPSRH